MSWIETLSLWRHVVLMDLLRYAIPAGLGFLVFRVWLGRAIAHRRTQARCPRRSQIWRAVGASRSTVFLFSLVGLGTVLAARAGHTRIYTDFAERGAAYALLSFAAIVVLHDAYFYWTHRLLHLPGVFERVHRVLSNVIGHIGFELHPRWFASHPLTRWMTTTTHHDLHHQYFHGNYGLYFTWWDEIAGTTRGDYSARFAENTSRVRAGTRAVPDVEDGAVV
jgi:sterol desaturase/sphingolipid hydroxylase (fatty acid hydroxylase superfamily)